MDVLVTGGAGFIGSNLVDRLIELGHNVVIVDNFLTGSRSNLNPKAIFYEVDVRNKEELEKIFDEHKPEYVFHLAAGYLVQSIENPQRDAEINIIGTINIIELCLKYKVKKIIYSNSGGASYGEPQQIPIPEEHPIHPLTPYGASKYTAEMYLYMYYKNFGLKYTSLRYANVYGPRQNPKLEGGVVSVFLNSFLREESPVMRSDGTLTRDYVYVGDVIEANIMAMNKGNCEGYNVATGTETSVLELIKTMKKVLNTNIDVVRGPLRVGDQQRAVFDITKIKREIRWEPKISLEEGIKRTIEWMKVEIKKEGVLSKAHVKNKIKGIILAAGIGERMRPLTNDIPKPMLKINNKTLLEYLLEIMKRHGICDIGITTFYLKDLIINYFKDGSDFGVNLTYLKENELLPSARAIKEMLDIIDEDVIIINGDNLTNLDLGKLLEFHKSKNSEVTIVSYLRNPSSPPSSQIDFDENFRIKMFREKLSEDEMRVIPPARRNANAGIYVFNKRVIQSIDWNESNDLGKILHVLIRKFNSYVYVLDEKTYYREVGKIEKYNAAKEEIESGKFTI